MNVDPIARQLSFSFFPSLVRRRDDDLLCEHEFECEVMVGLTTL